MAKRQANLRVVWMGEAMRELRAKAGMTAREAGAHLNRDASSISRMEGGEIPISTNLLNDFMDMCGLTDPRERADLQVIRRDAAQSGWWDGYRGDIAADLMDRAWIESKARSIQAFDITNLPGLLQTPDYARAIMTMVDPTAHEDDIERWVDVRMTRQHILTKHHPAMLTSVIDQALLQRQAGARETMQEQLFHLADSSKRDNITVRILPSDKYLGAPGSFELYELASPYPTVAHVLTTVGDVCVEGPNVTGLEQTYDRLWKASLDPTKSRRLINAMRKEL